MYSKNNNSYKLFLAGIISESEYFDILEQQPAAQQPAAQQPAAQQPAAQQPAAQQPAAQQPAAQAQQKVDPKKQAEGLFGQISKTFANQLKADPNLQAIMPQFQKYFIDLYAQTAQKQAAQAPQQQQTAKPQQGQAQAQAAQQQQTAKPQQGQAQAQAAQQQQTAKPQQGQAQR